MFMGTMNMFFMAGLIISTLMSISSSSWFMSWMFLEMNLMVFIPLIISKSNFKSSSMAIKYFLVQSFASMFLMLSFMLFYMFNMNSIYCMSVMMMISMSIKSGIPPFHFWMPQLLEMSTLPSMFLMLTWQKIAPLNFMMMIRSELILFLIVTSGLVGALGGLNTNSLKKILIYSSMVHSGWMIFSLMMSEKIWAVYFLIYMLNFWVLISFLKSLKTNKLSDLIFSSLNLKIKLFFCFIFFSLGGLPPFIGFLVKSLVIIYAMKMKLICSAFLLVFFSFISLLYYLKISFNLILNSYFNLKMFEFKMKNSINFLFLFFTVMMLFFFPMMLNFF